MLKVLSNCCLFRNSAKTLSMFCIPWKKYCNHCLKFLKYRRIFIVLVAQWIARWISNPKVPGSNPGWDITFCKTSVRLNTIDFEPNVTNIVTDHTSMKALFVVWLTRSLKCAPGEDWTHDLQIMRLTRCLLRYWGLRFKIIIHTYFTVILLFDCYDAQWGKELILWPTSSTDFYMHFIFIRGGDMHF